MCGVLWIVFKSRSNLIDFAFKQKRELLKICTDRLSLKCIPLLSRQLMFLFKRAFLFWMPPSHLHPLTMPSGIRTHGTTSTESCLITDSCKFWPFLEVCCANTGWAADNPLAFCTAARCCWSFRMAPAQLWGRSLWTHLWSCTLSPHFTGNHLDTIQHVSLANARSPEI